MEQKFIDLLKERIHSPGEKFFIKSIKPEEATDSLLKRMYKRIGGVRGNIANIHQSQSLNPEAMKSHLDLHMELMYNNNEELSRRTKELLATSISFVNSCKYCIVHHSEALKEHWEDAPEIENIFLNPETSGLSEIELKILEFGIKLTVEPYNMNENDVNALKNVGLTDTAILDVIMIICYFNFVNRLVMATGCPLESKEDRNYKY